MQLPRFRFTTQRCMVAVAVLGLAIALAREGDAFRFVFFLTLVGFPVLLTGNRGMTLTLRTGSLRAGYCYFAGVVGPAFCLELDPFSFRNFFVLSTMLSSVRPFGCALVGFEMALLTLWLWSGEALSPWSGLIAGALRVGAVFAAYVGLVLVCSSVPGSTLLTRVLGFLQLLAAHAYYVQGGVAARLSDEKSMARQKAAAQVAGATLAVVPPLLIQTIANIYL